MSLGRVSLKDNREPTKVEAKPVGNRTSVIMAILGSKPAESTNQQTQVNTSDSPTPNLRKSNNSTDAVLAYHNNQGGIYGAKLTKIEEPPEMPKLKGRLSKILSPK